MAARYAWRTFTPFSGVKGLTAQTVGESIQKIKDDHGGELRPRFIWEAAKSNRHPLHKAFPTWDVELLAEAHLDSLSRKLIGSVRIVSADSNDDEVQDGPAFISIRDATSGVSYRTLDEILDSADLQMIALQQAERDLLAFERRYREFTEICDAIRAARELVAKRRGKGKGKGKGKEDEDRPTA